MLTDELRDLYRRHAPDVYRFAVYLSGDRSLADDIMSETFLRVYNSTAPIMWVRNPLLAGAFVLASTIAAAANSILGWRHRAEEKNRDASGERGRRR